MAYEIPGQMVTVPASADLTAKQYTFVTVDANGQAASPAAGGTVFGVLQNKPEAAGVAASVMINGLSKVKAAGSTVAAGDVVAASTAGRAIAVGAGNYAVGRVIAGSSGSTDRILTVDITPVGTT